ncbi:MAG: hypothetical protein FJ320_05465 [SAR202 cluster bacterium]|nr:hypothetical protein [SAR202 cluster bacterium]
MIYGIIGITLWTDNLHRLKAFYKDTLRLPLHSDHGDFVVFRWGDMRLNLGLHSRVHGPSKDPYRTMVHFGVKDIHSEYERLKAAGVEFIRVPEREDWGGWVATFKDPDGNVLQMLELPK